MSNETAPQMIQLTEEQLAKLRLSRGGDLQIGEILGEAIAAAAALKAKNYQTFWDEVARLAGYANLRASEAQGYRLELHWLTGQIELQKDEHRAP